MPLSRVMESGEPSMQLDWEPGIWNWEATNFWQRVCTVFQFVRGAPKFTARSHRPPPRVYCFPSTEVGWQREGSKLACSERGGALRHQPALVKVKQPPSWLGKLQRLRSPRLTQRSLYPTLERVALPHLQETAITSCRAHVPRWDSALHGFWCTAVK